MIDSPHHNRIGSAQWQDHVERKKTWAEIPKSKRDKIRTAAKKRIKQRISEVVRPFDFKQTKKGTGWVIVTRLKIRGIYLQPSQSGDRLYFNLSKQYRFSLLQMLTMKLEIKRLGHFHDTPYDQVGEPGSLYYYDIEQSSQYVDEAMTVLVEKAIPWLLS
jgi:hypothetical protein